MAKFLMQVDVKQESLQKVMQLLSEAHELVEQADKLLKWETAEANVTDKVTEKADSCN